MKAYPLIDGFKFIASILVLIIHFRPFSDVNPGLDFISAQVIARVAVPFFLLSTGYFLGLKGLSPESLGKEVRKVLKLYLTYSLIYLPVVLLGAQWDPRAWSQKLLFFVRDVFFQGTVLHLWYLPAVAFAVFLLGRLLKHLNLKQVLLLAFVLYLVGLFGDGYYGLLSPGSILRTWTDAYLAIFASSRNGLFFAFFFITLGAMLAQKSRFSEIRTPALVLGFMISLFLMFAEILGLERFAKPFDYNMFLSLIPTTVFLLFLGLRIELKEQPVYGRLRALSSLIYFNHMWVFYLLLVLFQLIGLPGIMAGSLLRFSLSLVGTLLFSFWILKRRAQGKKLARRML